MSALTTLGICALYALLFIAVVFGLSFVVLLVRAALTMPVDHHDVLGDDDEAVR